MFVTIEQLRNSHAMQDRVTKVENYLKRVYSNRNEWNPKSPFPIAIVMISNSIDDYQWVVGNRFDTPEPFGGVNPANYEPATSVSNKASAEAYVKNLLEKAAFLGEPLLQYIEDGEAAPATGEPVSSATDVEPEHVPVKPALVAAPSKKPATDRDFPQHLAAMRTRAQLDNALQAFINNKMVKVLRPLESAEAKAIELDVPNGKKAYVIVF